MNQNMQDTQRHIVALGGGGFSMEASPVLDDYILGLARRDNDVSVVGL